MTEPRHKYPIIAISGLPRVGSMWSYNVARSLARRAGLKVFPEKPPTSDEEMLAAVQAHLRADAANTYCIVKAHRLINDAANLKVIYGMRDLRDQIYSLCRFMNKPLDERSALGMVTEKLLIDSHYERWPPSRILRVRFDAIEHDSINLIRRIAEFIELPAMTSGDLREIDDALSKGQIKKVIADLDHRTFGAGKRRDKDSPLIVKGHEGSVRAFDEKTGFQSGHVSDYRSGDWQHLWSDEQKQLVDSAIRIATRNQQQQKSGA